MVSARRRKRIWGYGSARIETFWLFATIIAISNNNIVAWVHAESCPAVDRTDSKCTPRTRRLHSIISGKFYSESMTAYLQRQGYLCPTYSTSRRE